MNLLMQNGAVPVGTAGSRKHILVVAGAGAAFANADALILVDENHARFALFVECNGFDGVAVAHYATRLTLKFDAEMFGLGLGYCRPSG